MQGIRKQFSVALSAVRAALVAAFTLLSVGASPLAQAVDFTNPDATIIDVRTLGEWQAGHLDGALRIEWQDIQQGVTNLSLAKDQPIYLYCRSGARAGRAEGMLKAEGYTQVYNMGSLGAAAKLSGARIVR